MPRTRSVLNSVRNPQVDENRLISDPTMQLRADKTLTGEPDPLAGISLGASALTIFLIFLVGAAGTLAVLSAQSAEPLVLTIMGLLATLGAFFVFAIAAGHVRLAERNLDSEIAAKLTDRLDSGCLLTTPDGRVLFANKPGVALLGRNNLGEINS